MILNTQELINNLTGTNKTFISKVSKTQEEKYGNVDIFSCVIQDENDIEMCFGDYYIRFFFRNDTVYDTIGNGQGHKYHHSLESCAAEIRSKYINNILYKV